MKTRGAGIATSIYNAIETQLETWRTRGGSTPLTWVILRTIAVLRSEALVTYLEFLLQEGQKLLPHELVAEYLGEGPDIAAKGRQAWAETGQMGRLVMATPDEEHTQAFGHKQLLVIPPCCALPFSPDE